MADNQKHDISLVGGISGQSSLLYGLPQPSTNPLIGGLVVSSPLLPASVSISAPIPSGNSAQVGITGPLSTPFSSENPSHLTFTAPQLAPFSGRDTLQIGTVMPAAVSLEGYTKPDSPMLDVEAEPDNFIGQSFDQLPVSSENLGYTGFTSSGFTTSGNTLMGVTASGFTMSSSQAPSNVMPISQFQHGVLSVPQLQHTSNVVTSCNNTSMNSEGMAQIQPTFAGRSYAVAQVNPYRIAGKVSHTPVAFEMGSSSSGAMPAKGYSTNPMSDKGYMKPTGIGAPTGIMESTSISQPLSGDTQQYTYEPVKYHWMYRIVRDSTPVWMPFSRHDSALIDLSAMEESDCVVQVDGGRYMVDVGRRLKTAIYWEEPVTEVRRCSWFFRSHGESYFQPYEEHAAQILEEQYAATLMSGDFHKKIEFSAGGGAIVIHSPTVILHFADSEGSSEELDAWGNTLSDSRPRALRRGLDDMDRDVPDDEAITPPDHLVLVVHGLGATARWEGRFRGATDLVSDMRMVARQMIKDHFKDNVASGSVSRTEFLSICYRNGISNSVLESEDAVSLVTPSGISKLRGFGNESLLDALFYSSPSHAQSIISAVAAEINRIYSLFMERNPSFRGSVSLVGHSSGAVILFDLLNHQGNNSGGGVPKADHFGNQFGMQSNQGKTGGNIGVESLSELLNQLGLTTYEEVFNREQIDLDSLKLLKPDDIKELGLPMGPRKKLLDFLQRASQNENSQEGRVNMGQGNEISSGASPINSGIDTPSVTYPSLLFCPSAFFALGSPLALYISLRRMQISAEFALPTCARFYNIFHPYDPSAYRIEPLLLSKDQLPSKPLLVPHHKGRKRLHLELRESLVRVGADLKQKLLESWHKTWRAVTGFAASHITGSEVHDLEEPELGDVDSVLSDLTSDALSSAGAEEETKISARLNAGSRVDYVLQEKPIEMFNDYLFAVGSRSCYWLSEDTVLMLLRELYGLGPTPAGTPTFSSTGKLPTGHLSNVGPPPLSGFVTNSYNTQVTYGGPQQFASNKYDTQPQVSQGFASSSYNTQHQGGSVTLLPSHTTVEQVAGSSQPVQTGLASKQSAGSSRFGPPLAQFSGSKNISQGIGGVAAHSQGLGGVGGSRSSTPVLGLAAPTPLPSHLIRK